MTNESESPLTREFTFFAEMCKDAAPLYAALSARVAADEWIRGLSVTADPERNNRNPPANMLFGAVQHLLLGGADHPLRTFYPSIVGRAHAKPPENAWPAFTDFCRRHESAIRDLVATRRVQTNEVGRCGVLLPGLEAASQMFRQNAQRGASSAGAARCDRAPLYLIELGPSAGLNLLFDRYRYEYSSGAACGDVDSPVVIRVEVRGGHAPPVPEAMPAVAGRAGVDLSPIDVTDDDQTRWLQALVWADDVSRHTILRAAIAMAQHDPPRIVHADGLAVIPDLVAAAPADALPVVFHSHAIYQMTDDWRRSFADVIESIGRHRDLARLSLEWLGDNPGPQLRLSAWRGGARTDVHFANAHHHGRWIEWRCER